MIISFAIGAWQSASKKRQSLVKRVLVVGGCLILVEMAMMVHFQQSTGPTSIREVIARKVEKAPGLSAQRREILRIQLALNDYKINNGGKLPASLNELRPTYFDSVPIDPETGAPFAYSVENGTYRIGEKKAPAVPRSTDPQLTSVSLSPEAQKTALIASLDAPPDADGWVYDATGKREPFRPFDLSPRIDDDPTKTPLERYEIGQLKLSAVLGDSEDKSAIVENTAGRGFIVKKGTKIGLKGGEVVEILPDRLRILETETDFTGQKKTNVVEMVIRSPDMDPRSIVKSSR